MTMGFKTLLKKYISDVTETESIYQTVDISILSFSQTVLFNESFSSPFFPLKVHSEGNLFLPVSAFGPADSKTLLRQ